MHNINPFISNGLRKLDNSSLEIKANQQMLACGFVRYFRAGFNTWGGWSVLRFGPLDCFDLPNYLRI